MCATKHKGGNNLTPCRLSLESWPICYADGCYLNNGCPAYRGIHPNPYRDYLPRPVIFIPLGPFDIVPISFHVPRIIADL